MAGETPESAAAPAPEPVVPYAQVQAARDAGYTDTQIANHVASITGQDLTAARKAGYDDAQILAYLSPKPAPKVEPPPDEGALIEPGAMARKAGQTLVGGAGETVTGVGAVTKGVGRAEKGQTSTDLDMMRAIDDGADFGKLMKAAPNDLARLAIREYQLGDAEQRQAMKQRAMNTVAAPANQVETTGEYMMKAGEDITAAGKETFPVTPQEEQRFDVKTAGVLASIVKYVGVGATTGPAALPALMGVAGVDAYGETYNKAKTAGATDEDATKAALMNGAAQGALMALPVGQSLKIFDAVPAALKGNFLKALTESAPVLKSKIAGVAAKAGEGAATLFAFSQLSTIADNVAAGATYEPGRAPLEHTLENIPETLAAGAILPLVGAGANRLFRGRDPVANPKPVLDAPTIDDAIAKADQVASGPVDVGEFARGAAEFGNEGEKQQAKLLQLFQGLNEGEIHPSQDGGFAYHVGEEQIPLKVWDEKAVKPAAEGDQHGAEGETSGEPETPPSTISPALAKAQREFYRKMGIDVVYFENDPRIPFDGAVDPQNPNTIFLSNDPQRNATQVAAHEVTHVLESTALPDGTRLVDILHGQIARGLTPAGLQHGADVFGKTAPQREAFPEGEEGNAAHADAYMRHLIGEIGADIGGEAPKFQTFLPKVVNEVQARYGDEAAKGVIQKLIQGFQQAYRTLRGFFFRPEEMAEYGQPETQSQHWVTNLGEIHDTLAKMYAERFGSQAEKENAALVAMKDKAAQARLLKEPEPVPPAGVQTAPAEVKAPPADYEVSRQKAATYKRWIGELERQGASDRDVERVRKAYFDERKRMADILATMPAEQVGAGGPTPRLGAPAAVTPPHINPANVYRPETYGAPASGVDRPAEPQGAAEAPEGPATAETAPASPVATPGAPSAAFAEKIRAEKERVWADRSIMGSTQRGVTRNEQFATDVARERVMREEAGPQIEEAIERGIPADAMEAIARFYRPEEGQTIPAAFDKAVDRWMTIEEAKAAHAFGDEDVATYDMLEKEAGTDPVLTEAFRLLNEHYERNVEKELPGDEDIPLGTGEAAAHEGAGEEAARGEGERPGGEEAGAEPGGGGEVPPHEGGALGPQFSPKEEREPVHVDSEALAPKGTRIGDLRLRAHEFYKRLIGTEVVNEATGRSIKFDGTGRRKTMAAGEDLVRLVPALPELLKTAEPMGAPRPDRGGRSDILAWHAFRTVADVDGKPFAVVMTVREMRDGSYHYSLEGGPEGEGAGGRGLPAPEDHGGEAVGSSALQSPLAASTPGSKTGTSRTLNIDLSEQKDKGPQFSPRETPLLNTPEATPEELASRQRQREKEEAEARMRGRKGGKVAQESADETPLFGGPRQGALFSPKQTETPEFKRWFGDSKVVDKDGEPLVIYHGSAKRFAAFSKNKATMGGITWFTSDKAAIESGDVGAAGKGYIFELFASIKNPAGWAEYDRLGLGELKARGYDGAILPDRDGTITGFVFEPTQLKSTDNRGTFDPDDRRMRYSPRLTGESNRKYTPEERKAYEELGRAPETKTIAERWAAFKDQLGKRMLIATVDKYLATKSIDPMAYMAQRNFNSSAGALEVLLTKGTLRFNGNAFDFAKRNGGVEANVIRPLHGEHDDWAWWVAANRAERLSAEDREHLFTPQQIAVLKKTNQGRLDFDYQLPDGKTTRSREAAYTDTLRKYDDFNKNVMSLGVKAGLFKQETVDKLWANPFYVPFFRVAEKEGSAPFTGGQTQGGFVKQYGFKKLEGGTQKLHNDLWENVIGNWGHLIDAAGKNVGANEVLDAASLPANGAARKVTAQEHDHKMTKAEREQSVWTMVDGKKQYWHISDPLLFDAVSAIHAANFTDPFSRAANKFSRILRMGVTSDPRFMLRVTIKDSLQAIATAPMNYNVAANVVKGYGMVDLPGALKNIARTAAGLHAEELHETDELISVMAGGGLMRLGAGHAEGFRKTTAESMSGKELTWADGFSMLKRAARASKEVLATSEDINRAALYSELIKRGVPHDEASFAARDLEDFTLSGAAPWVRWIAHAVTFLNAGAQGLYKVGRSAADSDRNVTAAVGGKLAWAASARVAKVMTATVLATLALDYIYRNDEDYKKRSEYDRNGKWWFKVGQYQFQIPMGFELAGLARIATNALDMFFDKEMTGRRWANNALSILGQNMFMDPTPTVIAPAIDVYANTSATGHPIEPKGMENLRQEQKYTSEDTLAARGVSTIGNKVARGVMGPNGAFLSPIQLDYLWQAYTGWLGSAVLGSADRVARQFTNEPVKPAKEMWGFITGNIVSKGTNAQSRYIDTMYQQAEAADKAWGTYQDLIKRQQFQGAQDFYKANADLINRHGLVDAVVRAETSLNQQIRLIQNNPDPRMTGEQKRLMIQQLQAIRNRTAESAFGAH